MTRQLAPTEMKLSIVVADAEGPCRHHGYPLHPHVRPDFERCLCGSPAAQQLAARRANEPEWMRDAQTFDDMLPRTYANAVSWPAAGACGRSTAYRGPP